MYKTKDLGLVAALAVNKVTHRETEKIKGTVLFIYDETEEFELLSNDYYSGRLSVDAQEYFLKLKVAKQAMYSMADRAE